MKYWLMAAAMLLTGAARAESPKEPESSMERSADMLLIGIPTVALGLTFLLQDDVADGKVMGFDMVRMTGAPRHDLGLAMLRTTAVTYGLKYAVDEERPNGEGGGFPSGHTAITFAGAEFIRKQYGWGWGVPAYAAAGFVGWSRVQTDDHWTHDVLAGAAIGVLSNYNLSDFRTSWGGMSLKPTMFRPEPTLASPAEVPSAAPGLQLELRF